MRHAARLTLFILDRTGLVDPQPDVAVLEALLSQPPLISVNPDGSRVFVFDLDDPGESLGTGPEQPATDIAETLRQRFAALAEEAHALSLTRVATLAEVAEILIGNDMDGLMTHRLRM